MNNPRKGTAGNDCKYRLNRVCRKTVHSTVNEGAQVAGHAPAPAVNGANLIIRSHRQPHPAQQLPKTRRKLFCLAAIAFAFATLPWAIFTIIGWGLLAAGQTQLRRHKKRPRLYRSL